MQCSFEQPRALRMAVRLQDALCALLLYAALTVCLNFFLAIAVTPALLALLHSLLLERIFAPYMEQDGGA